MSREQWKGTDFGGQICLDLNSAFDNYELFGLDQFIYLSELTFYPRFNGDNSHDSHNCFECQAWYMQNTYHSNWSTVEFIELIIIIIIVIVVSLCRQCCVDMTLVTLSTWQTPVPTLELYRPQCLSPSVCLSGKIALLLSALLWNTMWVVLV